MAERDEVHAMGEMYRLGMDCLVRRFGIANAEVFLAAVKTGSSDYTGWRRQASGGMAPGEFDAEVARFTGSRGKSRRIRPGSEPYFHEGRDEPLPSDEAVMQPLTTACGRPESENEGNVHAR